MQDAGRGQPSGEQAFHALPFESVTLAAAPKRVQPQPPDLAAERADRPAVAGHGVVLQMARTTLASQRPCSGMGRWRRRLSWSLTAFSLARIRFLIV